MAFKNIKSYLMFLHLVFHRLRRRGRDRGSCIVLVLRIISFLLLLGIFQWYWAQTQFMTQQILQVIGFDRNTSEKAFPVFETTIISPSRSCQFEGRNALAVILVNSMAKSRGRRELLRTTWASQQYSTDFMVFFFLGRPDFGDLSALHTEEFEHRDIIVDDLEENYYALGIKSLRMLKWFASHCRESRYFIKVDDDVLLNIPLISQKLKQIKPHLEHVGGRLLTGKTPNLYNPFSKWYTPTELWPPYSKAPNYIGGGFYIIPGDLVPPILNASSHVPLYHLEDVFITGMIASQTLSYTLYHFPGSFDPKYPALSYYWHSLWNPSYSREHITSFHTDGNLELVRTIYLDSINN